MTLSAVMQQMTIEEINGWSVFFQIQNDWMKQE